MDKTYMNEDNAMENVNGFVEEEADVKKYGMGWHKFLIYFSMFAASAIYIIDGILCFKYIEYNALMGLFGVIEIALGVFYLFVRNSLAKFRENAINLFLTAQILVIVYSVITSLVLESFELSTIIASVTMTIVNRNYYTKRKDLFIY